MWLSAKAKHINDLLNLKDNGKRFWSYIRNKRSVAEVRAFKINGLMSTDPIVI